MKTARSIALSLTAVWLCSCGTQSRDPRAGGAHENADVHGIEFTEGKGLSVAPETGKMLGLEVASVTEARAAHRIDLALRVFGGGADKDGNFRLASGMVRTNELGVLRVGQKASIAVPEKGKIEGTIVRIDPETARFTGLAEVIVRIEEAPAAAVGTFLDGHVTATTAEDVVVIPRSALLKTAEGSFAYVANGGSFFRTKIEVGGQEGGVVEVAGGLYAGDEVVLRPVMPLWLAELQAIRGGKACADGH